MIDFTPALSRQYDALLERETITQSQMQEAEERVLCDMDGFTDWLGGACMNEPPVHLGFVPSSRATSQADAFRDRLESTSVAELLCVALTKPQWSSDAMVELRSRYVAASAARIHSIAGDL